jgi:hypothetical protein
MPSAFIDPKAVEPLDIPCPCPPLPNGEPRHDHDTIEIRTRLNYGDLRAISRAGSILGIWDNESATLKLMEIGIVSWTFADDEGNPTEPSPALIRLLDPAIADAVQLRLEQAHTAATEAMQLPNGSSGRSEPSSPAILRVPANRAQRRSTKRSTPRSSSARDGRPSTA